LQQYRSLERAFKPLKLTVVDKHKSMVDEEKTVDWIAQTEIFQIVSSYKEKKVFSLTMLIDKHHSMEIYDDVIDTFTDALSHYGVFFKINFFYLDSSSEETIIYRDKTMQQKIAPKRVASNEKNLILILSHCITPSWYSNHMYSLIQEWSKKNFCSIVQMLPRNMWLLTSLAQGVELNWKSNKLYPLNQELTSTKEFFYFSKDEKLLKIPVIGFEANSFYAWGNVTVGDSRYGIAGFGFSQKDIEIKLVKNTQLEAKERVENFLAQSSMSAKKLAAYLASLPVSYEVARYVQSLKLKSTNLLHISEVFLGGLIERKEIDGNMSFDFYEGVREKLNYHIAPHEAYELFLKISKELSKNMGSSLNFSAYLHNPNSTHKVPWSKESLRFAQLGIDILKRKGGIDYERAVKLEKTLEEFKPTKAIIPKSKRFQMGSNKYSDEKPVHEVIFNYDFEIAKYPVTFEEYDFFCEDTEIEKPDDEGWGRGKRPVINVSWEDAKAYCKWISEKTGEEYRLPTEAEWEYSCRAGTTTEWSFGDDEKKLKEYAWYDKNSKNSTHEVGQKLPNPWGLHDMHGNVLEWCEDWYMDNYEETPIDGSANESGEQKYKVLRGGSWDFYAIGSRSSYRNWYGPDVRDVYVGFRLLRTLPSDLGDS